MPSKTEWAVAGIIIATLAGIGIALYLTRKPAGQGLSLKRIQSQPQPQTIQEPKVVLQNEERAELIRDSDGNLTEIVIHRKVTE